jgi:hypothetical protein
VVHPLICDYHTQWFQLYVDLMTSFFNPFFRDFFLHQINFLVNSILMKLNSRKFVMWEKDFLWCWVIVIQDIKVQDIWGFFMARLYRCKNLRSSYFTYWFQYPHLSIMDLRALSEIIANSLVDAIIDILVSCNQAQLLTVNDYYWWQPHTDDVVLSLGFWKLTLWILPSACIPTILRGLIWNYK